MIESLEPALYNSISPIQAFQWTLIAHQKVLRVFYSYSHKKEAGERSATKFARDTKEFYNPKITKVEVTVEGVPNELYSQNMEYRHQYDEVIEHFAEGWLKEAGAIQKDLQLHNVNIASYYTDKYALRHYGYLTSWDLP